MKKLLIKKNENNIILNDLERKSPSSLLKGGVPSISLFDSFVTWFKELFSLYSSEAEDLVSPQIRLLEWAANAEAHSIHSQTINSTFEQSVHPPPQETKLS